MSQTLADEPTASGDAAAEGDERRSRPLRAWLAAAALLFVVGTTMSATVSLRQPALSPVDEVTHLDYAYRASHGEIPRRYEAIDPYIALRRLCLGLQTDPEATKGRCDPDAVGAVGGTGNYNAKHPPLHYLTTGVVARVAAEVTGAEFTTTARLANALWLGAAMSVLVFALRAWRLPLSVAAAFPLLLPLMPGVLSASAAFNNDAVAPMAGSLTVLVAARIFLHGDVRLLVPTALAGAVAAAKVIHTTPLLALAGVLTISGGYALWHKRSEEAWKHLRLAASIVAIVGVVYVGWDAYTQQRSLPAPEERIGVSEPIDGLPFDEWSRGIVQQKRLVSNFDFPPEMTTRGLGTWAQAINPFITMSGIIGLALFHRDRAPRALAGTFVVGTFLYPLVVQLQALPRGVHPPFINQRYGYALIPLALALLALTAERTRVRWLSWLVLPVGAAVVLTSVFSP